MFNSIVLVRIVDLKCAGWNETLCIVDLKCVG